MSAPAADTAAPPVCPYCTRPAEPITGQALYGHLPRPPSGWFWICYPCDAWVGCHRGTKVALGTPAKAALRALRSAAHAAFDPLWQVKMLRGHPKAAARQLGYQWLARQLGIDVSACHIGQFTEDQCQRAIEACRPYIERAKATSRSKLKRQGVGGPT